MYLYKLLLLLLVFFLVDAHDHSEEYVPYPWHSVLSPYGNGHKVVKIKEHWEPKEQKEDPHDDNSEYKPYPWHSIVSSYDDRHKPVKNKEHKVAKDPKESDQKDEKFFFYQPGPYVYPYVLYTHPYYAYDQLYHPVYNHPVTSHGGYYVKKDNKEKYSPIYKD